MRDTRSSYALDTRGLAFAVKTLAVVVLVFGTVHYGTTRASEYVVSKSIQSEVHVASVSQAPRAGSHFTQTALAAYEATLSGHTTGIVAFDTVIAARARMIAISGSTLSLAVNGTAIHELPILNHGRIPTGLSLAHTVSSADDIYPTVSFPGCLITSPQPESDTPSCITLSADDAARVAEFVGESTPILVIGKESVAGKAPSTPLPKVSAKAFIVADLADGSIYAAKDAETARPIASISKLFTALVARETIRDNRTMTVTREDQSQTEGVPGSIRAGESFTVDELLYPLLMESNNSAAYTLARYEGADQFIERIKEKTTALGMNATTLDDPSGLSANNVASPKDLVTLLQHIQQYHSLLFEITGARTKTLRAENGRTYSFSNFNHFAGDEGFVGGKTGFIAEAGQTYAGVFDVTTETGTSTIAIVVLGSEDRKKDTAALLSWFRDR